VPLSFVALSLVTNIVAAALTLMRALTSVHLGVRVNIVRYCDMMKRYNMSISWLAYGMTTDPN